MLLNRNKSCQLTGACKAVAIAAAVAAVGAPVQVSYAQTCGSTIQPTLTPPGTIFNVGESLVINLTFGPTAAAGGSQSISQLSVRLDCENASGCDVGNPCVDDGNVLSYDGDATIVNACPGITITSNQPGGGAANDLIFTFAPALVLPENTQCTLSFGVTILSLSTDGSPAVINGIAFFTGTCASGGLTGSACGTYAIDVIEETGGFEGRTPGFWKQVHHFGHWPAQWCPSDSCGCTSTLFCDVFNCAAAGAGCSSAVQDAYAGKTLLQVLGQGGGGFKALGRHAVAGLLNSGVDPSILDYPYSTAEVINMVNDAIATCQTQPAHGDLADSNELEGGDLGGQSFCTDLNLDGSVNDHDLTIMLGNWGNSGTGDVNNDGVVGPADLSALLSNWGSF